MDKPIFPVFLSCQGAFLTDKEKYLFNRINPLGICLFSNYCNNIHNKQQIKALVKEIKETIGRDNVLIAVDQEGGRVNRLISSEFMQFASQSEIKTVQQAKEHAYLISYELKTCGINTNFAPVLDIEYDFTSSVLHARCFKGNEKKVTSLGKSMVNEYIKNGICPCIKHLPGHGRAQVDPHLKTPIINESIDELQKDFYPFKLLKNSPMGMLGHIILTAIDTDNPSTFSKKVINGIIRNDINFNGLLVSDALIMKALNGTLTEKAEKAISAGCDVLCLGNASFEANEEICKSKIALTDEATERLNNVFKVLDNKHVFNNYEQIKNNYCENIKSIITYNLRYDATEVLNRMKDN